MFRRLIISILAVLLSTAPAVAQVVYYDDYYVPRTINVGSLDAEIARGKLEATKANNPALEFEVVKLYIRNIVQTNRVTDSQPVSFANVDKLRHWLQDVSQKTRRPYNQLLGEIIAAVAPNPIPELTGDDYGYLQQQAIQNTERRTAPPPTARQQSTELTDTIEGNDDDQPPKPERKYHKPPGDPALIKIEYTDEVTTRPAPRPKSPGARKH
jgi:hypothetical protein